MVDVIGNLHTVPACAWASNTIIEANSRLIDVERCESAGNDIDSWLKRLNFKTKFLNKGYLRCVAALRKLIADLLVYVHVTWGKNLKNEQLRKELMLLNG
jgi:hypothetical protein